MTRRTSLLSRAGLAGGAAALLVLVGAAAQADPTDTPGGYIPDKSDTQLYAGVGADAFAELSDNLVSHYNATNPTEDLESYDAVNPVTGATGPGETISTKPGCTGIARPNGANAGISAILGNVKATGAGGDGTSYCIDWVRSSRARGTAGGEANLTFYAQSRDAVGYSVIGNGYAPTTPLTKAQLKGIFECTTTDWSQVGGQAGPIHVYLPPDTAATLTFFLTAIGSSVNTVDTQCRGQATVFDQQQNDGRTMNGDPLGIAPYAVTKWAAQQNANLGANAPAGIPDNRGGAQIGGVVEDPSSPAISPTTTTSLNGVDYTVLNPQYATGQAASFGRYFFNVVRNDAPADLKAIFAQGGYLCTHANDLLVPYGNTPLGDDTTASQYCGKPN